MPAHGPAGMTPARSAMAALKDTHLFWGPALELEDDDGHVRRQGGAASAHGPQTGQSEAGGGAEPGSFGGYTAQIRASRAPGGAGTASRERDPHTGVPCKG
jgi:hypothetical protein